ncbi:hypothetical protein FRC03_003492, partial [Tulasnella sp. 419]
YGQVGIANSVKLTWIDHPGDSLLDVRSRPLFVCWNDEIVDLEAKRAAIQQGKVVFRAKFTCAGSHNQRMHNPGDDMDDQESTSQKDGEEHGDDGMPVKVAKTVRNFHNIAYALVM